MYNFNDAFYMLDLALPDGVADDVAQQARSECPRRASSRAGRY